LSNSWPQDLTQVRLAKLAAGAFGLLGGGYLVLLVQRWRALQAALAGLQANAEQQEVGR